MEKEKERWAASWRQYHRPGRNAYLALASRTLDSEGVMRLVLVPSAARCAQTVAVWAKYHRHWRHMGNWDTCQQDLNCLPVSLLRV